MDDALPEAVEKLGAADGLLTALGFFSGSGMQKYQVKIRSVAKLQSTEFAPLFAVPPSGGLPGVRTA